MLKKLLYLYNDGHNPFPHMKGKGLHLIDGEYEYDGNPADEKVYDQGFIVGDYAPNNDGGFLVMTDDNRVFEVDRREEDIKPPDYYKNSTSVYDDYDNDAEIFGQEDDDDLELINDEINKIKNEIGISNGTYTNKLKLLEEEEKAEKKNIITIRLQQQQINNSFVKLAKEADKAFDKSLKSLTATQKQRFRDMFEDVVQKMDILFKPDNDINDSDLILTEANKIVRVTKQPINIVLRTLYKDAMDALDMRFIQNDNNTFTFFKRFAFALSKIAFPDEIKMISELANKEYASNERLNEIKEDKIYFDSKNDEIKILQQQYAERKKLVDQKKRLSTIKQLALTDPEQALKDSLELNAELKAKEALETGKKLSKAAEKKAKSAAKKAAAEKQAEAPVVNAQSALKTKGTYGKKLEDFFASNGQPILQKFTGDTSKIKDIEKDDVIPDEIVTFNDKTKNSLRKACTLDLYNNKYVFEIKNYVNNSFDDDVIPMQPSKFAGTEYFKPRYLKDGSLYSLNLNYTSPITGIHHTQNVLPANTNGREVVFIIRLKEGLYQYKPFLDHKNTSIIPTGETTQDGRPLYFFESTKLKKCLDYKGKPAFNLKGHLTPI